MDLMTATAQLFLYRLSSGQIPSEHLKREKTAISIVVATSAATDILGTARYLASRRDGDIFVLSDLELNAGLETVDIQFIMASSTEATVYVLSNEANDEPLPPHIITYLFQLNLLKVFSITDQKAIWPYKRPAHGRVNILFVSPGSIYPLSLGSHQRMFNSIQGLLEADCNVTILYQKQRREREAAVRAALSLVAVETRTYNPAKGKLKGRVARRRALYDRLTKLVKLSKPIKETFAEKCQKRSSYWLHKELKELGGSHEFHALWVNYAWMMGKVDDEIRTLFHTVICDTHDVQFYRNEEERNVLERLVLSPEFDKKFEINRLKKSDIILAISSRDAKIFRDTLPRKNIITLLPSFDHHQRPIRPRDVYSPLHFGFIGTRMDANVLALDHVLQHWWPEIHKYSPESRFLVAGSVCGERSIQNAAWLHDEIELLGFVEDLAGFYNQIDVLLSPVLVKGGLNFKNIEAAMAGKHIFTNSNGVETMAPVNVPSLSTAEDVIKRLTELETNPELDVYIRLETQRAAASHFSNAAEFTSIVETIDNKLAKVRST